MQIAPERVKSPARGRLRRPGQPLRIAAVVLAAAGLLLIGISSQLRRWAPPPMPPASAAQHGQGAGQDRQGAVNAAGRGMAPSARTLSSSLPVSVRIPAIGVTARIEALGLAFDGTVQVPALTTPFLVSWYDHGAAPGSPGPTVLFGHVDSYAVGPAVFYRLGDLRPGDLVYVTRHDHKTAVFSVDYVNVYPQWDFPGKLIYGYSPRPVLRLITCGGEYDTNTHLYLDRTVAFARYVGHE